MTTIECENLVHVIRYMNKERRAGATSCGALVEFQAQELLGLPPTCVACVAYVEPECTCRDTGHDEMERTFDHHYETCPVVENFAAVDDRIDDVVYWCIQNGEHNKECDDDGFCQACGYQFEGNLMRTSP